MVVIRPRQVVVDAVLAATLCVLDLVVSADTSDSSGVAGGAFTPLYAAAGYVLLMWRRRFPGWVLAGMVTHSVLAWVLSHGYVPTLGVWLALYTLAARRGRRQALAGLAGALLAGAFNVVAEVESQPPEENLRVLVISAVAMVMFNLVIFGVGRWSAWTVRQRHLVAQRAAADAQQAERYRIARDLHDIVAHAVTLMLLHAGGAARLLQTDPPRAEEALRLVDELGQQAIVELRRMLGLLTAGGDGEPDSPQRVADIASIVDHIATDDLHVTVTTTGKPVRLDEGVDVSAYRIVREALTNAVRYADPRHPVQLGLHWQHDALEITVVNHVSSGRKSRSSPGRGLIGMRERAHAAGGTFRAGPATGNRFAVHVTLPGAIQPQVTHAPVGNPLVRLRDPDPKWTADGY